MTTCSFLFYDNKKNTLKICYSVSMNTVERVHKVGITTVPHLKGKKILLRIDVNTTLLVGTGEDWRIEKSLKTIKFLRDQGAIVILISHIGDDGSLSLKPVYEYMAQHISLGFIPHYDDGLITHTIEQMQYGSVIMLENIRQHTGEKKNNSSYLDAIIKHCDMYVNDAFSVSHREHASVADVTTKLPSYFGIQFCEEVDYLSRALETEKMSPRVLVLGGAKFGTKLDLLRKFLPSVDYALIGGALANVFLRERGIAIGASFADDVVIDDMVMSEKILLPVDVVDQHGDIISVDEVGPEDMILDIGPQTEKIFEQIIDTAQMVLWNGPMGKYEDNYVSGSIAIAESMAHTQALSLTGGGDTAAVILQQGLQDNFDFISTGGGAMLDFLVTGTLPGIEAILKKNDV